MKKGILALLVFAVALVSVKAQKEISGNWKSTETIQTNDNHFASKEYTFDGDNWHLEKIIFKDEQKSEQLYKVRSAGTFKKSIDKTSDMVFTTKSVFITLLTDDQDLISEVGLNYCPLIKGEEVNITETGCAHIRSAERAGSVSKTVSVVAGILKVGKTTMKKTS